MVVPTSKKRFKHLKIEAMDNTTSVLRVKGSTNVGKLAGSIVSAQESGAERILVRAIGASALNQATKAIIISNKQFIGKGLICSMIPSFSTFKNEEVELTAIELTLKFNFV